MPRPASQFCTTSVLRPIPFLTSRPSLAALARTTGLVSFDTISNGMPASRSSSMPRPSARLTRTDSRPSWSTIAESSV